MGGSFTYEYLGQAGNSYKYKLKIQMFRDCQNSTTPFDQTIRVGIYNNNFSKNKYDITSINLKSETTVNPPSGGSNCSFVPNVCIRKGYYEKIVYLPYSSTGYHLLHQRCCRNNLTNLAAHMGQSYYAFIPAQSYQNNSPYFSGIPTPYICANDTINISYSAIDPDGDSLVYSFVRPNAGGTVNDPAPYPSSNLSLPLTKVYYASSYSFTKPFGITGISSINHNTGLVKLMSPQAGLYAIAVEVKEYRNAVLLSSVIRDIELIILNCPKNDLPKLLIKGGVTSFTIEEGDIIGFDIKYTDKDSMYFTHEGGLFGGSSSNVSSPYATLSDVNGKDTIKTAFLWQTSCNHGRSNPYFFTVTVKDNGCPYKTTIDVFQIKVDPFTGPDSIRGAVNVCEYDSGLTYVVYGLSDNSHVNWQVSGGTIKSGQGTDTIIVDWGSSGSGILKVYETSRFGCGPELQTFGVNIYKLPEANAGKDRIICSRDTIILGDSLADTNNTYIWSPSDFLNDTSLANPQLTIKNITHFQLRKKYYLTVKNKNDCISTDSVLITINPEPDTFNISGSIVPCYKGIFEYKAPKKLSSTFYWTLDGGTQMSGANSYAINILWTDSIKGKISVVESNTYGCIGDTSKLDVKIIRPQIKIIGPNVVCPNVVNVDFSVKESLGSTYQWKVYLATRTDFGSKNAIKVSFPDSGIARITAIETTKEGCVSDSATKEVIISYHLETSDIFGDTNLCAYTLNEPYNVLNVNGSNYNWKINGGNIIWGNGKNEIGVNWAKEQIALLQVFETSYDSVNNKYCYGDTVYQKIVLNPLPNTSPINGNFDICEFDTFTYSVQGFQNSIYVWEIDDSNIVFSGQYSNTIEVYWQGKGDFTLSVLEITKDSCTNKIIDTIVHVHPIPTTSQIFGDSTICFPDNSNKEYSVNGFTNSSFNWTINGGIFTSQDGKYKIFAEWLSPPSGYIQVQETSEWGCIGEIKNKVVSIDSLFPNIKVVTTKIENDLETKISWELINDQYYNRKTLLFKGNPKYRDTWNLVDSFPKNVLEYVDKNVLTHEFFYDYIIAVSNVCSDRFESSIHRSILLKGNKTTEFDIKLSWNDYIGWKNGVERYDIYRRVNDVETFNLYNKGNIDTTASITVGLDGRKQCYRIVAVQKNNENLQSWSNEICFEYDPVLHIPTAFTPNNDGLNDTFKVKAFNLSKFNMIIFNRWGEKVFSTNSTKEGWDGYYKGNACDIGTYIVIIQYEGNTPNHLYKGTITLIK